MVAPPKQKSTRVKISKSGQVTLPAHIRRLLGVKLGGQVEIVEEDDGTVRVKPVHILTVEEIAGKYGRPVDPQELQDTLQEARRFAMVRQRYRDGSVLDDLD